MAIRGEGWELLVRHLGTQQSGTKKRSYGTYQAYINGIPLDDISGNMCESVGPGDNSRPGNGKCIEQGRYPLWTQFGRYRSIGYSEDTHTAGAANMPGVRLEGTGRRVGILIHPAHPPNLYLSSIGCFNPTKAVTKDQTMDFWDSRGRVIAILDRLRDFAPDAFRREEMTKIDNAWVVVDPDPAVPIVAELDRAFMAATAAAEPASLPISRSSAIKTATWMMDNYGDRLRAAVAGKQYRLKHLCAMVCQETAYKWLQWTGSMDAETIIARCVFDASGDYPGTERTAFPKNTAAFLEKYGDEFTDMLIEEANITRRLQGYSDKQWVYKGYGIFQFDLQHVKTDRAFFEEKKWYDFGECLARCCGELDEKLHSTHGDLWLAIKAYNGSGSRAQQYMENVRVFTDYCAQVTGD